MLESIKELVPAVEMLTPYEIDIPRIRVGPPCDGGYILADKIGANPILSFGAGTDISFEVELAERGNPVFLFDHTVPRLPATNPRIKHFLVGISGNCTPDNSMVDLAGAISMAGLADRNDLILKMDVEGDEYDALADSSQLSSFEQIAIEVHWLTRLTQTDFRHRFEKTMHNLLKYFTVFHVHGNNCALLQFLGGVATDVGEMGGIPVVDVIELSLIRNDLAERSANQTKYPMQLDYPNRPDRPDHLLDFFPFSPRPRPIPAKANRGILAGIFAGKR